MTGKMVHIKDGLFFGYTKDREIRVLVMPPGYVGGAAISADMPTPHVAWADFKVPEKEWLVAVKELGDMDPPTSTHSTKK